MPLRTTTTTLLADLCLATVALAHEHDGGNAAGEVGHGATTDVRTLTIV